MKDELKKELICDLKTLLGTADDTFIKEIQDRIDDLSADIIKNNRKAEEADERGNISNLHFLTGLVVGQQREINFLKALIKTT